MSQRQFFLRLKLLYVAGTSFLPYKTIGLIVLVKKYFRRNKHMMNIRNEIYIGTNATECKLTVLSE